MRRLARFILLLLTVAFGGYFVGAIDGRDRPLEHAEKPWVVRVLGL